MATASYCGKPLSVSTSLLILIPPSTQQEKVSSTKFLSWVSHCFLLESWLSIQLLMIIFSFDMPAGRI
jgi:hypothetical protein